MSRLWSSIIVTLYSASIAGKDLECPTRQGVFAFANYGVSEFHHSPPLGLLFIDTKEMTVTFDDYREEAKSCESQETVVCFRSNILDFSMVRRPRVGTSWSSGERRFEIVARQEVKVFGERETLFRIVSQKSDEEPTVFYYNEQLGLRMVVIPNEYLGTAAAFFSTDSVGPFAPCSR